MKFDDLGLRAELMQALQSSGYVTPTPVQGRAIPAVLEGRDVLAGAQTGTGKTAAFALPILQTLSRRQNRTPRLPLCLVLTPTRELADQVAESFKTYGQHLPLRTAAIYGGVGFNPQVDALRRGLDVLVATPGRLLDHIKQQTVDLSKLEILVLDEADRMLDMGFIPDIRRILKHVPQKRQTLFFSATYSEEIRKLAEGMLHNPVEVEVAPRNKAAELVEQALYHVGQKQKRSLLSHLIREGDWHQVLVFTRTKHGANRLAKQLNSDGVTAMPIHGNKSQSARTAALAGFKKGTVQALIATDIASRGLDISQLPHVVNYDLPHVPEDYVHRIGRTGRAGSEGVAISLVSPDEIKQLRDIERLIRRSIEVLPLPRFEMAAETNEPDRPPRPAPRSRSQPRAPQGNTAGERSSSSRAPRSAARPAKPAEKQAGESDRPRRPRRPSGNREQRPQDDKPKPAGGLSRPRQLRRRVEED